MLVVRVCFALSCIVGIVFMGRWGARGTVRGIDYMMLHSSESAGYVKEEVLERNLQKWVDIQCGISR